MFFCSFSLIFQSACLTSSDSLVPSLVSPVQQRGAVQVTLQGGAFHSRLLYRGRTGAGSSGQEGGSRGKILVRFYSPQRGWLAQGLSGPSLPGGPHHQGLVARALSHSGHPSGQCGCPSPGNFGFSSITDGSLCPEPCSCSHPVSWAEFCYVLSLKCHWALCTPLQDSSFYLLTPQDAPVIPSRNTLAAGSSRELQISLTKVKGALNYTLLWLPGP